LEPISVDSIASNLSVDSIASNLSIDSIASNLLIKKRGDLLLKDLEYFGKEKTKKLSKVNQSLNIILTVTGITFTALTSILGVGIIDNSKIGDLLKISLAFTGSAAVASQAASREFRLKGKAGKYMAAEAERTVLISKTGRATTLTDIESVENAFDELRRNVGKIEGTETDD